MKLKKIIGLLVLLILATIIICSNKTYAANSSYVLGITNIREAQSGRAGGAYGIGGKTDGGVERKIWKIVSYPNTGSSVINYDNAFYCLKAEHGFVINNGQSVTGIRKNYDTSFNMKTQRNEVMTRLNSIGVFTADASSYNKILWILDHMYLPKQAGAQETKQALLEASGVTGYQDGVLLTDDDIEVVQQMAIWYFTNTDNQFYNKAALPTLLFNNWSGNDANYKSFADLYDDNLANTRLGQKRQYQAEDLFTYFIQNADGNYTPNDATAPISLNKTEFKAVQTGDRYIVGPLRITMDTSRQYNISELRFTDQNGTTINLTGENKLLNEAMQEVASGNIQEVIGQKFYISLPLNTNVTTVNFTIRGTFPTTKATYYTTNNSTYLQEQPVVLVEKTQEQMAGTATIQMPSPKYLDLALRKSITKINSIAPTQSRIPQVDATALQNGTSTTATYNHPKNDLEARTNQLIEYTITVYNEGGKNGYAAEIKDYLPAGIEFVELVSPVDKYRATSVKNADGTTTVTITNIGRTVLEGYTTGIPKNEAFTIRCRVTQKAKQTDTRLVNIAEITKYFDSENNAEVNTDRDSTISNFPQNIKNNAYIGNGTIGNYTKGQEDDDDFEPIVIPGQYFDLALRKFITAVNGVAPQTSREPQVELAGLIGGTSTTATYNHPKAPISVQPGDIVTYTIRVYNEGQADGYAKTITDHLPAQLEFLPDDEENISNGWVYDENDISLRTIRTNHLSKDVDIDNIIKAFDGVNLYYKDLKVKCRVKQDVTSGQKITNIADITEFTDSDGTTVVDRDSQANNVILPPDEQLPFYKDTEIERGDRYILGQQDDDDFEKLKVQIFDLALRKFITAVNNQNITNRIPVLSMGANGNIQYNHTKVPVEVKNGDIVTYTLRIYNEGDIEGYAQQITDNLPQGLQFLPDNNINQQYRWKMLDQNGNETQDTNQAVKVVTDYLSKEQETVAGANLLKAFDKTLGITDQNPDYRDIKIAFKVVEPATSDRILTNIAEISEDADKDGNPIDDIDSIPGNNKPGEDDIDEEHVKLIYFDLALRKFITKVNNTDINNRIPVLSMGANGNIQYNHTKVPVEVEQKDIVTYTLRIYNEGKIEGYAKQVTDDIPQGLQYLPDNNINQQYRWKMLDQNGNETQDVNQAVKVVTDYLSKEQETVAGANLLKAFDKTLGITDKNPDYRDIKIVFKVIEPTTSDRILTNTAEISEDTDKDGNPIDDIDSIPGNNKPGEDDIDVEHVKVKYFDLALKKWVSQTIVTIDGKQTITNTGHTGDENPEPVVKVDLKSKDINKVTVKFAYKIKIINEGQIAGYAKEVKDYIPDGLKFIQADNPKWKALDSKTIVTDQLKDTLLQPGETATVDVILTWINGDNNLGLKVNIAEISKDYNESETPDIDSTPDNKVPGEDDIDDAPVILGVKTGEAEVYIILTSSILITLAGGIILIKKYII